MASEPVTPGATPAWPPAGWVANDEAARMLGVSVQTFTTGKWPWRKRLGDGTCMRRPDGRPCRVYRVEEIQRIRQEREALEAEREKKRQTPFPPPGVVDRFGAAALLGIGTSTLIVWVREGRLGYAGTLATGPNGVECRIYAVAELERAREEMNAADAERSKLPDGFVDHDGAARFLGIQPNTVGQWQKKGWLGRGTWLQLPSGVRQKVFAVADLERVRQEMQAEAALPAVPEGFVHVSEAARMLGVSDSRFYQWELQGLATGGQVVPIPGTSARTKIYPLDAIESLREKLRIWAENFPPDGWVTFNEAARLANVTIHHWKHWCNDGRVESGQWFTRPTGGKCKLVRVEEVERIVEEEGRDHLFFMEPDGQGGWRPPEGYVDRRGAAAIFGVSEKTIVTWQTEGLITCGRWARMPLGTSGGRRVYPAEELHRLDEEFSRRGVPYTDPSDPSIVRVPIMSWRKTRFEAIIDAADLPLIQGKRWNWSERSDGADALVVASGRSGEQIPLRRIILGLKGRQWNITHRNGDPLDCRRANLVVRDIFQKAWHQRKRKTAQDGQPCTSRFKGVCWIERLGKWFARIQKEGVVTKLGLFDDEIDAAEAYDEAARELFGEHARLNFPDGVDARLEAEAELLREAGEPGSASDTASLDRARAA